ncbi:hypothetical protein BGZ83_004578 [Gryganskiella cystojenkinii]|nr:hypothetical protein BGZ83_004578 [Gryganskiella cystojenkinii]
MVVTSSKTISLSSSTFSSKKDLTKRSATERALAIPEILERILSFLPGKSRDQIGTLVCKGWHSLLCCQHHENHHRYPRHLYYSQQSKDWRSARENYGYAHDKTSAIGSARGGSLFDVRFGCWTDQREGCPKFEQPDIPPSPKSARKRDQPPWLRRPQDSPPAYPIKPCILQSSQWTTHLGPAQWQYRNDWGHFRLGNRLSIGGNTRRVPINPVAPKISWMDYLDGLGALEITLTGENSCLGESGPMTVETSEDRWVARKELLSTLRYLSRTDHYRSSPSNSGYQPREQLALLELEVCYMDLTYPVTTRNPGDMMYIPWGGILPPESWPGDYMQKPIIPGDDYDMFLRPLTSIPGVAQHLRKLALKHVMIWPRNPQRKRRKGRRSQRRKKGQEEFGDDEGLFPIGPILKTCRQLEELTIEVDPNCTKVGRDSEWPDDWVRPKLTVVLFIEGAVDEESNEDLPDYAELNDDEITPEDETPSPDARGSPEDVLSGLKLKKLRLKDVRLPEVVFHSLLRAAPNLSDIWIQAPAVDNPLTAGNVATTAASQHVLQNDLSPYFTCDQIEQFRDLGALFPQLARVHFGRTGHRNSSAQVRSIIKAFPHASRWALSWRDLGNGVLENLNRIVAKSSFVSSRTDSGTYGSDSGGSDIQVLSRTPGLYSNFLTSLEIVPALEWTPQWGDELHIFLCEAWHLEYLRAGSIGYFIDNMDLNNLLSPTGSPPYGQERHSENNDVNTAEDDENGGDFDRRMSTSDAVGGNGGSKAVWACRKLKHLQLELIGRRKLRSMKYNLSRRRLSCASSSHTTDVVMSTFPSWRNALRLLIANPDVDLHDNGDLVSRILFGYLARFCPRLEDLTFKCYKTSLALRGGFTLLTEIPTLRRMTIIQMTTKFQERDVLPWAIKSLSSSDLVVKNISKATAFSFDRPSRIMEKTTRIAWRWLYQQEMKKIRKESEFEIKAADTAAAAATATLFEQDPRIANKTFTNKKGAQWMCTVTKDDYRDLGYLRDVVRVLTDLVEPAKLSSAALSSSTARTTWPDLLRLRFIQTLEKYKSTSVRPLLKKHRPELDFEYESWNHDERQ